MGKIKGLPIRGFDGRDLVQLNNRLKSLEDAINKLGKVEQPEGEPTYIQDQLSPGWGDGSIITINTEAPSIPTDLTLSQAGVQITAEVTAISLDITPDFTGYRVYAYTVTGAIPVRGMIVSEGSNNVATFQKVYDCSTEIQRDIVLGNTIYVRVSAFDKDNNESLTCDEGSIIAGGTVSIVQNVVITDAGFDVDPSGGTTAAVLVSWDDNPVSENIEYYDVIHAKA